jgi:signal transduction histidine kinase
VPEKRSAAFARLFDGLHEGIYIGTIEAGRTTTIAANPHLKLIFGYASETPEADVRPFDADRFVDPQARVALRERLASDAFVTDYLLRLRRADETAVWVEVTARAEPPAANGSLRVEAIVRDVSERKKLDDETRSLYHQLLQAEKMAALGQTISGVAHELNNPLATILSWSERLSIRKGVDEQTRRGLEMILGEAERAARIVRSLLTFARKRQTTRMMVDVNQVVRETLSLRAYDQRVSNISVIDALAAGLPPVFADAYQLQQVLLNLVINAEQAMLQANGRGVLVVRTWHDAENERVTLEINDDGPGIPEDVQSKIFDPFFTTKEVGQGTGLGLTVAYAIIQEHAGRIHLQSGPQGTSFFVELPVTGPPIETAVGRTKKMAAPAEATGAGAAILLVEDESALASAVLDALRDAGYTAEHAADGRDALALVERQAFDFVICDLKMPRLDGMAFHRALTEMSPRLAKRMLFVTGDVADDETGTFFEQTGCRWLPKPFRLRELLAAVSEGLGA